MSINPEDMENLSQRTVKAAANLYRGTAHTYRLSISPKIFR